MSRWEKLAPLSGVGSLVLVIVSTLLFNFYDYLPDPAKVQAHFADNSGAIQAAANIGLVGAFLLMWFAGSVRGSLRSATGNERLSALAFGGGIAAGVIMAATYCTMWAAAAVAGSAAGIDAGVAAFANTLYGTMFASGVAVGLAAMIAAYTAATVRAKTARVWTAWVGGLIAIGLLSPVAYIVLFLGMLWVAVMSIRLFSTPAKG